jgi:phage tail protein X
MATVYNVREGDTVDFIAWRYYGTQSARVVEQVYDANPLLADYGPELPAGLEVVLPDIPAPGINQGIRLWD